MLKKFRKGAKGFTLIELLIVVAIIGILAAVAIPQFSAYRIRGYNSAAHSDAKNIVTGQEAYFVDFQAYLPVALQTGPREVRTNADTTSTILTGAKLSNNVAAKVIAQTTSGGSFYTLGTSHNQGDRIFYQESDEGKWKFHGPAVKTAGVAWDGTQVSAATSEVNVTGTANM